MVLSGRKVEIKTRGETRKGENVAGNGEMTRKVTGMIVRGRQRQMTGRRGAGIVIVHVHVLLDETTVTVAEEDIGVRGNVASLQAMIGQKRGRKRMEIGIIVSVNSVADIHVNTPDVRGAATVMH